MDKVSYALGMSIANNLRHNNVSSINADDFFDAFKTVIENREPKMTADRANDVLDKFFKDMHAEEAKKLSEAGEKFLAENAKKASVTVLPSGLQYEVIKEGTGAVPGPKDRVKCHYEGTLIDGTVFDSSYRRGEPAVFGVSQVIQGWVEALQLMKTGSKWRLYIPYDLAYGEHGAGSAIPPYSALIFDVELLGIEK